jgi:hypothetical protein
MGAAFTNLQIRTASGRAICAALPRLIGTDIFLRF